MAAIANQVGAAIENARLVAGPEPAAGAPRARARARPAAPLSPPPACSTERSRRALPFGDGSAGTRQPAEPAWRSRRCDDRRCVEPRLRRRAHHGVAIPRPAFTPGGRTPRHVHASSVAASELGRPRCISRCCTRSSTRRPAASPTPTRTPAYVSGARRHRIDHPARGDVPRWAGGQEARRPPGGMAAPRGCPRLFTDGITDATDDADRASASACSARPLRGKPTGGARSDFADLAAFTGGALRGRPHPPDRQSLIKKSLGRRFSAIRESWPASSTRWSRRRAITSSRSGRGTGR